MMQLLALLSVLALCCCKESPSDSGEVPPVEPLITSNELKQNFPLLPIIEPALWQKLTAAEAQDDKKQIKELTANLQQLHPFENTDKTISLGGIVYHKADKSITIPATVNYPAEDDNRHPQEVELILCSNQGRTHETLFTTEVNPLHLELLLHLTGSRKSPEPSQFKLEVKASDLPSIPVRELLQTTAKKPLPNKALTWEFSGSDFSNNFYGPESTGDLIICWHVHDSVIRITDPQIASAETKLLPVKHAKLMQGQKVNLTLIPLSE